MTINQIADEMIAYLNAEPAYLEEINYLFNLSEPTLDWSKGKGKSSAASVFGDLHLFFTTYLQFAAVTTHSIETLVDYAYWQLLYPALLSIYVQKRANVPFTGTVKKDTFTFDGAGPKYLVVWAGLKETSFCAWGGNYTHIKFRVSVPQTKQYSYSLHRNDLELINLNAVKVTVEYNEHRKTVTDTIPELTKTSGTLFMTAASLIDLG